MKMEGASAMLCRCCFWRRLLGEIHPLAFNCAQKIPSVPKERLISLPSVLIRA